MNNNIIIDEVATKRFHKELEQIENIEDMFELLLQQIQSEQEA